MLENGANFRNSLGGPSPELLIRVLHDALSFDVTNFIHRIGCIFAGSHLFLFLFSPEKLLIEEIQNNKIQTPQIISSRQVLKVRMSALIF